jgi:hypothetical protein
MGPYSFFAEALIFFFIHKLMLLGAFFHLGALGGRLIRLVEEPALVQGGGCRPIPPTFFLFFSFFRK